MDKIKFFPMRFDLQMFADGASGGDGGTGAEGATGVNATAAVSQNNGRKNSNPLANVKYGVEYTETGDDAKAAPAAEVVKSEDRNAKFEALIKGEYKDLYDAKMQDTIQKRLKGTKETEEKYNSLVPTLEMLAKKYGVEATDIKALTKAIEEDDSYYEDEAFEKGITVQQLKEIRKMERENAELKREREERGRRENAEKQYVAWMDQANEAKRTYPSLDLKAEIKNPQFMRLLDSGVDVGTAYAVLHKDEIIPAAMQYTAKAVEEKIVNKIIAGGSRPTENGNSSQGAMTRKSDVSQLSRADREEIARRVARGEKISFG